MAHVCLFSNEGKQKCPFRKTHNSEEIYTYAGQFSREACRFRRPEGAETGSGSINGISGTSKRTGSVKWASEPSSMGFQFGICCKATRTTESHCGQPATPRAIAASFTEPSAVIVNCA